MGYNILVSDDEKEILEIIELYLKKEGYNIFKATDGIQALQIINKEEIHLAILDIMMPGIDGYKLISEIRKKYNIPIILISAKNQDADKILGLDLGADDYVAKPFNPLELVSRVNAQLRRVYKLASNNSKQDKVIKIGDVVLDSYNVRVTVREKEIELTSIEYGILKYLMENSGRIITKNQIFKSVWKEEFIAGDNTIMVHMSRLRDKIELDSKKPKYLKTVRGLGYKFEKVVDNNE